MTSAARFRSAYAAHRAAEGRGEGGLAELAALPYVRRGPLKREWDVRARSFERFVRRVLTPYERAAAPHRLSVLDLGAGNGWLCNRLATRGHACVALEWRRDPIDGLAAGAAYGREVGSAFARVAASFQAIPLRQAFDLVVYNAALHYATSLDEAIHEAVRVTRPSGAVVIVDSPFYPRPSDGQRMVVEKRAHARREWGARAEVLLGLPAIEYLTPAALAASAAPHGLVWRRHRVRYPWWYELRPVVARLRGRRPPSRFDVWEARVG